MTAIQVVDKGIFWGLLLYALSSSISIAGSSIGIAVAGAMAVIRYIKKPISIDISPRMLRVIAVFMLTMGLSAIFAPSKEAGFIRLGSYIFHMLPFFLIVTFLKDKKQILTLVFTLGLSITIADTYAIWQGLHGDLRASAFSSHPMIFAGYALQMLPFLFLIREECDATYRWLINVVVLLTTAALLFNGTRGAWIAVGIVFALYGMLHIRTKPKTAVNIVAILVLFAIAFLQVPFLHSRIMTIGDMAYQSNSERLLLWKSSWQMFLDHPLVGVGLGYFKQSYLTSYVSPLAKEPLGHAHSNFIHMLAETGLIGFLGFIQLFTYILYHTYQGYAREGCLWQGALFFVTLSLLIQGFTEFNFGNSAVIRMYWCLMGLAFFMEKQRDNSNSL